MICLVLERVPASLRGDLSRWLLEVKSGIFVGHVSPVVRDNLWDITCARLRGKSGALLIMSAATDQGLKFRMSGFTDREVVDFEGLFLLRRKAGKKSTRTAVSKPINPNLKELDDENF